MAKWYGEIGIAENKEVLPGVWDDTITPRSCFGDVLSDRWRRQNSGGINDDINISNRISIIADPYIQSHCSAIVYATFMDTKWKVTDVEVQYPRLILSLGGVWNGN